MKVAARVPVISSNTSCLPEVTGGSARLIDPLSPAELQKALQELLESPEQRKRLSELGRIRAGIFTWEKCAEASLKLFRQVA